MIGRVLCGGGDRIWIPVLFIAMIIIDFCCLNLCSFECFISTCRTQMCNDRICRRCLIVHSVRGVGIWWIALRSCDRQFWNKASRQLHKMFEILFLFKLFLILYLWTQKYKAFKVIFLVYNKIKTRLKTATPFKVHWSKWDKRGELLLGMTEKIATKFCWVASNLIGICSYWLDTKLVHRENLNVQLPD